MLLNVIITFTFPGISWQAHVGGFVGGALVAAILVYAPRRRRGTWQLVGLGLTAALIAGAILARTAQLG